MTTDQGICAFNGTSWSAAAGGGSGTVTSTSVVSANGIHRIGGDCDHDARHHDRHECVRASQRRQRGACGGGGHRRDRAIFGNGFQFELPARRDGTLAAPSGAGTVTSASVVSANGPRRQRGDCNDDTRDHLVHDRERAAEGGERCTRRRSGFRRHRTVQRHSGFESPVVGRWNAGHRNFDPVAHVLRRAGRRRPADRLLTGQRPSGAVPRSPS